MPLFPFALVMLSAVMHAGWNLQVRQRQDPLAFLRMLAVVVGVGIGPAVAAELLLQPVLAATWKWLLLAGVCQGVYCTSLSFGYRHGDFTVVYPLARALPAVLLAGFDVWAGHAPSALGWAGLLMVALGCALIPLESLRNISAKTYFNRSTGWTVLIALSTVGYTLADSRAAKQLPSLASLLQYHVFVMVLDVFFFALLLWLMREPVKLSFPRGTRLSTLLASGAMFGGYSLVLWVYQFSEQASYVVALRQVSIVLGVAGAAWLFQEPAARWRLAMATVIVAGVLCIKFAA